MILPSELIINPDGSIFHLHLKPGQLADNVILVGDPNRVDTVANHFSRIEHRVQNREFISVTGLYRSTRFTVVATGIGTDNIDIVVNELDALANVNFTTREIKQEKRSLNIVRIGTSGSLQEEIPVDSWVVSQKSIGFDGLLNFYANRNAVCDLEFEEAFVEHCDWDLLLPAPYVIDCSASLFMKVSGPGTYAGVNISAPGFYGPQGRVLRLPLADPKLNQKIERFSFKGNKITNFEMESSAIYGLSALLGHHALTVCLIIANRVTGDANANYKQGMSDLIEYVLDQLSS